VLLIVNIIMQDVVALYPIRKINGQKFHYLFLNIVKFVVEKNIKICAISVDNHSANRSFYKILSGVNFDIRLTLTEKFF